jgi:hypothetical protein
MPRSDMTNVPAEDYRRYQKPKRPNDYTRCPECGQMQAKLRRTEGIIKHDCTFRPVITTESFFKVLETHMPDQTLTAISRAIGIDDSRIFKVRRARWMRYETVDKYLTALDLTHVMYGDELEEVPITFPSRYSSATLPPTAEESG